MPETSELQIAVLEIVKEHTRGGGLFGKGTCELTNQQIFDLIKPESSRPSDEKYLSVVLKKLELKGKLEIKTRSKVGHRGLKRVITLL